MRTALACIALAMPFFVGCASIVNGTSQPVSVVAKTAEKADVMGARCSLTNSKGEWYATTPGSVVVHRAYGDMLVNCVHPSYLGTASIKSTTKGMAFGNIIFGGVVGAAIDVGNGSAYDYPDMIVVSMASIVPSDGVKAVPIAAPVSANSVIAVNGNLPPPPPKPARKPEDGLLGGQDGFVAEQLARAQRCHAQPRAVMTAKGPGFENYSIACENGDALAMRCEFGNCRVLR